MDEKYQLFNEAAIANVVAVMTENYYQSQLNKGDMIRIERNTSGGLQVQSSSGKNMYRTDDELPPELREKYLMLCAADVGVRIPHVGHRLRDDLFWIFTDKPEEDNGYIGYQLLNSLYLMDKGAIFAAIS